MDSPLTFPHFTILKASAGSGKTYALSRRFVTFLLSDKIPRNSLNNIMAITFSNNAAKEMKERVLDLLKRLSLGEKGIVSDFSRDLGLSEQAVSERANRTVDAILESYTDFQVKTIDSFMATVFKASALDFGYSPDFEIVMDSSSLMGYAFDLFLRRVREGTEESLLMAEIIELMLGNSSGDAPFPWEPTREILSEIEGIYTKLAGYDKPAKTGDYSANLQHIKGHIRAAIAEMEEAIRASGLVKSKSSSYERIRLAAQSGRFPDLMGRGMKNPPVCKPKGESSHDAYDDVMEKWVSLAGLIASYTRLYACSYYAPYLRAYEGFSGLLERAKRHEGKVFIEDINKQLAEYLSGERVPDVYFRLGEVIFHYLIDEFQDTSPIQWRNLFPLLENSLAQGGSLFVVGDTKQAIYGFRDADYRIMRGVETCSVFPSAEQRVDELHVNYRSDGAIIGFTEDVFHRMIPGREEYKAAAQEAGLSSYRQAVLEERKHRGYVETCLFERDDVEPPEREKLYALLGDLLARGYRFSDITVLTPRNSDVVKITTWLNARKIPFLSYSSLDIRKRKIAGEIIALLNFLDSPLDDLSFATFLLGDIFRTMLERQGRSQAWGLLHGFCFSHREHERAPLYRAFQEERGELWDAYFEGLFRSAGYLPLYDLIVEVYSIFDLFRLFGSTEEAVLAKVLEVVRDLEAQGGGLKGFLRLAAEEGEEADWNIDIPSGIDAVNVMTIHKAKGLGFPVVIVLLYGERSKGYPYIVREEGDSVSLLRLTKQMISVDADFEKAYADAEMKERVNKLNSLYVAFTRASSELYVLGVRREGESFPFSLFPDSMSRCQGELPRVSAPVRGEGPAGEAFHHSLPFAVEKGVDTDDSVRFRERSRGEIVHRLLSLVEYASPDLGAQVREAASRVCVEEGIGGEAMVDLVEGVRLFLENPLVRDYYERRPGRLVMVEQEFVDPSGRLFRVDRVVTDPDKITILEFKTGSDRPHEGRYLAQMQNYVRILKEVYPDRLVEGIIAYVDLNRIAGVSGP